MELGESGGEEGSTDKIHCRHESACEDLGDTARWTEKSGLSPTWNVKCQLGSQAESVEWEVRDRPLM